MHVDLMIKTVCLHACCNGGDLLIAFVSGNIQKMILLVCPKTRICKSLVTGLVHHLVQCHKCSYDRHKSIIFHFTYFVI